MLCGLYQSLVFVFNGLKMFGSQYLRVGGNMIHLSADYAKGGAYKPKSKKFLDKIFPIKYLISLQLSLGLNFVKLHSHKTNETID